MRVYLSSIDALTANNVEMVKPQMGKTVFRTEEGKTISYLRCGKGAKVIEGGWARLAQIIKAIGLSVLSLGLAPYFSIHIRANLRGRVIVALYIRDPATSGQKTTAQAVSDTFHAWTNIGALSEQKRVALFGKWPLLKPEQLMRLSKEQAVELVKQDPTYISGLTEEQKRMLVPAMVLQNYSHELLLHILRNIELSYLSDIQKSNLRGQFTLPKEYPLEEALRLLPLLNGDTLSQELREKIALKLSLKTVPLQDLQTVFGTPKKPNVSVIQSLPAANALTLFERNIAYIKWFSPSQREHVVERYSLCDLLENPALNRDFLCYWSREKVNALKAALLGDGKEPLTGAKLKKYFYLFASGSSLNLHSLTTAQLLELLPSLTSVTFNTLLLSQKKDLLEAMPVRDIQQRFNDCSPLFSVLSGKKAQEIYAERWLFTYSQIDFLKKENQHFAGLFPKPQPQFTPRPQRSGQPEPNFMDNPFNWFFGGGSRSGFGPGFAGNFPGSYHVPPQRPQAAPPPPPPAAEVVLFTVKLPEKEPSEPALVAIYDKIQNANAKKITWPAVFDLKEKYNEDELTKARRKIMVKCHSDHMAEEHKKDAEALFKCVGLIYDHLLEKLKKD